MLIIGFFYSAAKVQKKVQPPKSPEGGLLVFNTLNYYLIGKFEYLVFVILFQSIFQSILFLPPSGEIEGALEHEQKTLVENQLRAIRCNLPAGKGRSFLFLRHKKGFSLLSLLG
jgi:hypothetical protein